MRDLVLGEHTRASGATAGYTSCDGGAAAALAAALAPAKSTRDAVLGAQTRASGSAPSGFSSCDGGARGVSLATSRNPFEGIGGAAGAPQRNPFDGKFDGTFDANFGASFGGNAGGNAGGNVGGNVGGNFGGASRPELLAGWKEAKTADGRSYYYNATTKQTQWQRPS